jgi:hypothetical protein
MAMNTSKFSVAFSSLRPMITEPGTIFGFVAPRRNMGKTFTTNFTVSRKENNVRFVFAKIRTIFCGFKPVEGNLNNLLTTFTSNKMGDHDAAA